MHFVRFDKISPAREKMTLHEKFVARPPKEGFRSFCDSKIEMKSQRATFRSRPAHLSGAERHRWSASGAAVRRTRGSVLGRGLDCAFATRRVARAEASRSGGPQLTLQWVPQASAA